MSSEIRSNSSYAMSAIEFNSKSLNPLDSINPALINKIKRQADNYLDCAKKCQSIWNALAKNQMGGSNLTEKILENIFKEFQTDLYNFTKVNSIKEFMRVFDQDKDNCLNPDEQLAIFSFIKQRLELIANNCLQIQAYVKFETLMKEVRLLEEQIAQWQHILRSKIHHTQLKQYRNEGQSRVDEFCTQFDREFQNLQTIKIQRRETFQKQSFYEAQQLENRLSQSSQYLKIKPKNRLKQLQFQQKLVSLEERVYEALDFRKQLNELQITEKDRVDKLMIEHANQLRNNLKRKHEKMRRELQIKLEELEDKLKIKMKKQFQILRKKNNLHQMEIRRLQGLEMKWAQKKGNVEPELKRTKKLKEQRNEVLGEYKRSIFGATTNKLQDTISQAQSNGPSKFNSKSLLDATLKFKITSRSQSQQPINIRSMKVDGNMGSKINKYINPNINERNFSLTKMYDMNLQPLQVEGVTTENQKMQEKNRKYNYIMSKMIA